MKKTFLTLCLTAVSISLMAAIHIIPAPQSVVEKKGAFVLDAKTAITLSNTSPEMKQAVALFVERVKSATGLDIPVGSKGNIECVLNPKFAEAEGYQLTVAPKKIKIVAKNPVGVFYALQSVRQLLPAQIESKTMVKDVVWSIPAVEIIDAPLFGYRGTMLDVGRYFMPKEDVKAFIDLLAFHKINNFHWHLTEDQGWRIEIKKYPKLTSIGSKRNGTLIGHLKNKPNYSDNTVHQGFYTQEEIKEVVAYAQARFINVIPEIEFPGHAVAALASYPELSCSGGPFDVEYRWGIFNDVYCAGNEKTYQFAQDVLKEVLALFPSQYIHIGGDECPKTRWKRCAACQKKMKDNNLKDEHELQSYFIKRLEKFLNENNRKLIGWDEIIEGGLAPTATMMYWRGRRDQNKAVLHATAQGNDVIMTPNTHMYLDYYQSKNTQAEPLAIGSYLPLDSVYKYDPFALIPDLTAEQKKHIIGVQANIWREYMPTTAAVQYMTYPRLDAASEVFWTLPEKKNYENFLIRMKEQVKRYDFMGVNYRKLD